MTTLFFCFNDLFEKSVDKWIEQYYCIKCVVQQYNIVASK